MLRLIRWLEGYVTFAVLGSNPAEALTLASRAGIALPRVEEQNGTILAMCSVRDYFRLSTLLRKRNRRKKPKTVQIPPKPDSDPAVSQEVWWETLLRASEPPQPSEKPPGKLERALMEKPVLEKGKPFFRKKRRIRGLETFQADCQIRARLRAKNALTLRVVRRTGLSFRLRRYRKRIGIPVGMVLAVSMLLILRGFVWDIEISGNERIPSGVYLETMARYGLVVGARKNAVNTQFIVNQTALDHPEIGWMTINLIGNRAYVKISERSAAPAALEKDVPCNLIATADGRIVSVHAFGGQKAVQPGDWVAQGDLLVSGVFEAFLGGTHLVHAWGEVKAEVSRTLRVEVPMNQVEWSSSDARAVKIIRLVGGIEIPLGTAPEGAWVRTETAGSLALFGVPLPAALVTAVYNRVEPVERALTKAEAARLASELMQKKETLLSETGEIVSEQEQGWIEDGKYVLERRIVILQNIAREQEIYVSVPNQNPSSGEAELRSAG